MPKVPIAPEEPPATDNPSFDLDALLEALHAANQERDAQVAPPAIQRPAVSIRRMPRPRSSWYETILARVAILAALAIIGWLWYLGGTYTLAFLKLRGTPLESWGILAWLIPLAITGLEIGVFAARSRIPALWIVWAGVLLFDIFTTAAGVLADPPVAAIAGVALVMSNPSAWLLAGIFGTALALGPEPAARSLVRELLA
jgi:hypothetical protein